ncbi:HAD-IIIA family hydrolase [Synechococcus sp. UW179B]|uniref:D-glycero-alpha-D-manno-heptose-1,7-bisphosphate 7-phosphatase n=1 Tax=Synechococcus sp. UW179B TaxID=2575516 RepID=UPI000E0F5623|nr:HAD family hydrolase [Synechococcus sp. UW179B]
MWEPKERRRLLRTAYQNPTPALFLDRDGVLIEDRHYLCDPTEVSLCPGSKDLVEAAHKKNWAIVVITNQSGIARGYFDWSDYERVTDRLLTLLGASASIAGIYANGHGPEASAGSWRKPSPAMLLEACRDLNLDLKKSILVGDRLSDLEAGTRAGVQTLIHVLTGHGPSERAETQAWAEQQQQGFSQNPKPELWFLDSLIAFPHSLLGQRK